MKYYDEETIYYSTAMDYFEEFLIEKLMCSKIKALLVPSILAAHSEKHLIRPYKFKKSSYPLHATTLPILERLALKTEVGKRAYSFYYNYSETVYKIEIVLSLETHDYFSQVKILARELGFPIEKQVHYDVECKSIGTDIMWNLKEFRHAHEENVLCIHSADIKAWKNNLWNIRLDKFNKPYLYVVVAYGEPVLIAYARNNNPIEMKEKFYSSKNFERLVSLFGEERVKEEVEEYVNLTGNIFSASINVHSVLLAKNLKNHE